MTTTSYLRMLHHVRELAERHPGGPGDAELVKRFVADRDATAFEVLVWRHGGMVYRICRGLLRQSSDADDAFQATFLALARDAGRIRGGHSVSSWLQRVAYRLANRLRSRQPVLAELPTEVAAVDGDPGALASGSEQSAIILEEIDRLPQCYRDTIVLCLLEGKTHSQAADELNCPNGTIDSRLAWARQRLRDRLLRRGIAPAVIAASLLAWERSSAAPAKLVSSTANLARILAQEGAGSLRDVVSSQTWNLLHQTGSIMTRVPIRVALGVALFLGAAGVITQGRHDWRASADDPPISVPSGKATPDADAAWKLVASWKAGEVPVTCLLASPSGTMIMVNGGTANRSDLVSWRLPDGKKLFAWEADEKALAAVLSPDGKLLASAHDSGTTRVIDASSGKAIVVWYKNAADVKALAFSPDGHRLWMGAQDGTVRLWDLAQKEPDAKPVLAGSGKGPVQALLLTPDGKKLATAGDGTVRLWDVATGKEIFATMDWDTGKRGLASSPDGKIVAVARRNGVMLLESTTGKHVRGIDFNQREVADVAFLPDGKTVAVVCNPFLAAEPQGHGEVQLYDLATGKLLTTLCSPRGFLLRLAVTADGKHLVAGGLDGHVHVWQRTATPKQMKVTSIVLDPKDRIGVLVRDLARSGRTNEQCIDALFLAMLGRFPQEAERKTIASFVEKASDRESAFKDVVFQLTNTKEYGEHVKVLQQHQPK